MNKDKLILLVGASGSGKTTIAKSLEYMGYNIIHSYTTRKPRYEGEWGHTFVEDSPKIVEPSGWSLDEIGSIGTTDKSNMIAYFNGYGYEYWATKEQYQGKGVSIYVIDPIGALEVKNKLRNEDVDVITIYLNCSEKERECRMISDDREPTDIQHRLMRDKHIFSVVACDYVVSVETSKSNVLTSIVDIIESI